MKKKNLLILLLIPFIISLLGIVTVNVTFNTIENDIESIDWNYTDAEAFKISEKIRLVAEGVNKNNYPLAKGNNLVWSVENKDPYITEPLAKVVEENGLFYLIGLGEGEVVVTCSNEKGNITRQMVVYIYENGAILVSPEIGSSQNNIDDTIYYGEYDLNHKVKEKASFKFNVRVVSGFKDVTYTMTDYSSNIDVYLENDVLEVDVLEAGEAYITLVPSDLEKASTNVYKFNIVKDGVNVYSYDDLLECTNRSKDGEIVVLRKHFEAIDNAYVKNGSSYKMVDGKFVTKANNIECFGNYNASTGKFSFRDEIYDFETTYNQEYIKQWNAYAKTDFYYRELTNRVKVGLRIQKDFYGNGYTLNLHNLTYPYKVTDRKDNNGNVITVPSLTNDNLFRGPLPFYTLGDPNGLPLVTAFGQDNIGMYVEGNNITVNDINMKNCDNVNSLTFLDTVGTVLETYGDSITIKNSKLANGKHVIRSFSSTDILIDNCYLSTARNFLITTGTNEYVPIDGTEINTFFNPDGTSVDMSIDNYLKLGAAGLGDTAVNSFLFGNFANAENMTNTMNSIDDAFNVASKVEGIYKGSIKINNTLFERSGIASISVDTLFNGPFLYNGTPSIISELFAKFQLESKPLIPLIPKQVSGLSYPVKIELSGNTKFYDYKPVEDVDLTGLISENISKVASSFYDGDFSSINIDSIFPLRNILVSQARANKQTYSKDGKEYINVAVAYYGGGLNLSTIDTTNLVGMENYGDALNVKLLDHYISLPAGSNEIQMMKNMMIKTVTVVTGQNPFKFVCVKGNGYLFNETPNVSQLKKNLKGELDE